jgi:hypothetical protein
MRAAVPRLLGVTLAIWACAGVAQAQEDVTTRTDGAKEKLDAALQAKVDAGATGTVPVLVTVAGDPSDVQALLSGDHTATTRRTSLVAGRIPVQAATKVAAVDGVVSVGLVRFAKTGEPADRPDPSVGDRPSRAELRRRHHEQQQGEVPYDRAPPLKRSNFDRLKRLDVLDARTHDFTGAWKAGYAGEGTTVGVLDGGTDFGHPDLIGTWQTWSGARDTDTTDDGWNGWPKAFDPYGTLQLLLAPELVDQGLSWYTPTQAARCPLLSHRGDCQIRFATATGPSRNFDAPAGTAAHTYSFPRRWSKSGTVRLGSHPDDYLLGTYEERPAFLVVDQHRSGVYDTVYVDLDDDHDFSDEKPVTKDSPASYRDMNGDGYTDLSGGLLYFISDGQTRIPGGVLEFGVDDAPPPGALLAWTGDFDPAIDGHGTLTASNVVGQAVISGNAPVFFDLPHRRYPGAVLGGAPKAKLAPYGDIYFSFDTSTQLGYLISTEHGIDVTSNSYGNSDADNDGYDAPSQEADIIHAGGPTTPLFSTGNGAPGYGTTTAPSPFTGISVGASTQFGATGWDSIAFYRQVVDNDVIPFSNRGPGATGKPGVDVVADGAYSSGDATLNTKLDGRSAWVTWGGTSRSTPVAVSATALVYQAWRQVHPGAPVPGGFYTTAKQVLKSSATDLGYDAFTQGAGSVDAARAVKAAAGAGPTVAPDQWRVGDYRGREYPVFTHIIAPGGSDTQTFTVGGGGTWSVSDRQLKKTASTTLQLTTDQADESPYNFNSPDYLIDVSPLVRANPNADLMVVRAIYPHDQLDANGDYVADQDWRLLTYSWTDVNRDRRLWRDRDGDGVVDHVNSDRTDIDGNAKPDCLRSEMECGEYVRFAYHRPGGNSMMTMVRDPRRRMSDGIFVGFQHSKRAASQPSTTFTIRVDFYTNSDWSWLTTPASASGSFSARLDVPQGTPYGMYEGAIVLLRGRDSMVVPVSAAVAAQPAQDADGNLVGATQFGGPDVAAAQADQLYDNGSVFSGTDWSWRAESGDWRFYFYDLLKAPPPGTVFLADTTWDDPGPFTDLDTLIFGRSANQYQLFGGTAPIGAPYILDTVGKSENRNTGAGVWEFDTATGGPREVVTAPAQEGLQALVQHQVGWQGDKFEVPFTSRLGSARVNPASVDLSTAADSGTFDVTFRASVDLDGLTADAFGLSQPSVTTETAHQDDPNDPSTASIKKSLTLQHASRLTVTTAYPSNDVDLYLLYDANHDGQFTSDEIVAASTTGTANESVTLTRPPDGDYQIWVHGWQVTGTPGITLSVTAIQGHDLTVSGLPPGPVPAGTTVTLHVAYAKTMTAGQSYLGELLLGPKSAPTAFTVPIKITKR